MSRRSAAPTIDRIEKNGALDPGLAPTFAAPRMVTMEITPELATHWLNANTENRPVRNSRVALYAREMQEGRWRLNGEPIKWSKDGRLLDGQHRLFACIEANVPFVSDVRFGLEGDVFATLDRGGRRTPGDNLALLGEANADILAAALKKLVQMRRGLLFGYGPAAQVGPAEIIEALRKNPEIRGSLPYGRKVGRLAPPSLTVFLHYLFSRRQPALADWFMDRLGSGVELRDTWGVYHLRQRLEANAIAKARLPEKEIAALMIKAWNAHVRNRSLRALRWRNTGDKPEAFPQIL